MYMSKLGKKPIEVPADVTVEIEEDKILIKGKLGSLCIPRLPYLEIMSEVGGIVIRSSADHAQAKANWGTMASLVKSAILGVTQGFTKRLEIDGIGFRATMEGETLVLNVGFTHPITYTARQGIKISVAKSLITVSGIDKALVGETAARIRKIKKQEPYKGKG